MWLIIKGLYATGIWIVGFLIGFIVTTFIGALILQWIWG